MSKLLDVDVENKKVKISDIDFSITDDEYSELLTLLKGMGGAIRLIDFFYPIGSCICNENKDFNPNKLYRGTHWEPVNGMVLMGANKQHLPGEEVASGLPNITGKVRAYTDYNKRNMNITRELAGAFYWTSELENSIEAYGTSSNVSDGSNDCIRNFRFDASYSNSIYGKSTIVQPPALYVNIWKRVE